MTDEKKVINQIQQQEHQAGNTTASSSKNTAISEGIKSQPKQDLILPEVSKLLEKKKIGGGERFCIYSEWGANKKKHEELIISFKKKKEAGKISDITAEEWRANEKEEPKPWETSVFWTLFNPEKVRDWWSEREKELEDEFFSAAVAVGKKEREIKQNAIDYQNEVIQGLEMVNYPHLILKRIWRWELPSRLLLTDFPNG